MMSTTVAELGAVYCSVVSFANTQHSYELDRGAIIQSLIAIRLKLKRSLVLRTNIVYEVSPSCLRFGEILAHVDDTSSPCEASGPRRGTTRYWKFSCEPFVNPEAEIRD